MIFRVTWSIALIAPSNGGVLQIHVIVKSPPSGLVVSLPAREGCRYWLMSAAGSNESLVLMKGIFDSDSWLSSHEGCTPLAVYDAAQLKHAIITPSEVQIL